MFLKFFPEQPFINYREIAPFVKGGEVEKTPVKGIFSSLLEIIEKKYIIYENHLIIRFVGTDYRQATALNRQ